MSAFRYFTGEAAVSLWRRRGASVLSIITIVGAMLVLSLFLLVNLNVQRWLGRWTDSAELSIYLADMIVPEEQAALERTLAGSGLVASQELVSREEALRRFALTFPELAAAATADHLPASIEVRLRPDAAAAEGVEELAGLVRLMPGVADVRYDRQWIARLTATVRAGRIAGLVLAAVLVIAAMLTVTSVVRLALYARQQEIEIMYLVGAPLSYIRGPFVAEGILQGGVGALVAIVLLYGAYVFAGLRWGAISGLAPATIHFLPWSWTAGLLAGGMLVGCIGGAAAARRAR